MGCISAPTALLASSGLSAGTSLTSGLLSSGSARTAASQQTAAANRAIDLLNSEFQTVTGLEKPFVTAGQGAVNTLSGYLADPNSVLTAPLPAWNPTEAGLEATPGYKFTLNQGLQAVANQNVATGLSGAEAKAAAKYATGLADTTYNDQYANYLAGNKQTLAYRDQLYNMLSGTSTLGANAAANLGTTGTKLASGAADLTTSAGAATAAGTVGSTNALTSGLTNTAGGISTSLLLAGSGLFGNQSSNSSNNNFLIPGTSQTLDPLPNWGTA